MPQFSQFLGLAQTRLSTGYATLAIITRSAYHAEGKQFGEFLDELTAKD